jgi:hypothetical protein
VFAFAVTVTVMSFFSDGSEYDRSVTTSVQSVAESTRVSMLRGCMPIVCRPAYFPVVGLRTIKKKAPDGVDSSSCTGVPSSRGPRHSTHRRTVPHRVKARQRALPPLPPTPVRSQ